MKITPQLSVFHIDLFKTVFISFHPHSSGYVTLLKKAEKCLRTNSGLVVLTLLKTILRHLNCFLSSEMD